MTRGSLEPMPKSASLPLLVISRNIRQRVQGKDSRASARVNGMESHVRCLPA